MQNLLNFLKLIQGGIEKIPPATNKTFKTFHLTMFSQHFY